MALLIAALLAVAQAPYETVFFQSGKLRIEVLLAGGRGPLVDPGLRRYMAPR